MKKKWFCRENIPWYLKKILLKMKLTILLLTVSVLSVFAVDSYSQTTKLTLNLEKSTIRNVLNEIENKSEFKFWYSGDINVENMISISQNDKNILEILEEVFKGTDIRYEIYNRQIALYKDTKPDFSLMVQQPGTREITGTVKDTDGQPLIGVSIVVKGTTLGSITDVNGNFRFEVPVDAKVIVCTYVGMKTQEVAVEGRSSLTVVMEEDIIGMEEVVVVGYGTQKRINLTGAVSTVSSAVLEERPVTSVAQALQGVVPNLQITTTDGGRPGSNLNWQIRGRGTIGGSGASPLILIDGIPGDVNTLNPNDIESVSILKDAAASAIYGSRAPYGVVIITTKRGKSEQMKVTFNASSEWRIPTRMLQHMGSMELLEYYNLSAANQGVAPFFDQAYVDSVQYAIDNPGSPNRILNPTNPTLYGRHVGVDIDWWGETYRSSALTQNYNLSASGGSKAVTYYTSLGYFDQDGLYRYGNDKFKRYTGFVNIHAEATKWLELDFKLQMSRRDVNQPNAITEIQNAAVREWPIRAIIEPNGHFSSNARGLHIAKEGGRISNLTDAFNNTLSFIIKPFDGFRLNGDATFNTSNQLYTANNKVLYRYNAVGEIMGTQAGASASDVTKQYSNSQYYTFNFYADYIKQLANHNLHFLVGYQQEYNHWYQLRGFRNELLSQEILSLNVATGTNIQSTDGENEWANQGYFGRFIYNFKEKYLLEVNGRYDGSSRFPKDLRWGFFPSASAGYIISRESFFEPLKVVVDMMKFRASYGRLGNSNVGLYYSPSMSKAVTDFIGPSGIYLDYVTAPGFGNYSLTWEKPTTLNLGIELGFLKNRIQTTFDWYHRKTIDMVGPSEPVAAVLGASVPQMNNTEMEGKGWEFSLLHRNTISRDFHYDVTLNISRYRDVVTKYYNPRGLIGYNREGTATNYYSDKVLGEIWGYETVGFINDEETLNNMPDQTQLSANWGLGDILYKDQNNDGKVTPGANTLDDPGDLIRIGNDTPAFAYNMIFSCDFKGLDLRLFFNGLGKTDWWPGFGQGAVSGYTDNAFFGTSNNQWNHANLKDHLDYWTPENKNAYYARPLVSNSANISYRNRQMQTKYLQNRAFLRLKNVQLGYTLPSQLTKPYLMESARIYISGENLLTFTRLRIFEPETPGLIYPLQKVISAGIRVTL